MIANSARALYDWLKEQDFSGHDPHDLLESPFLPSIVKQTSLSRLTFLQAGRRSPLNLHALFKVPRAFNPKGGGLIVQGLLKAKQGIAQNWEADVTTLETRLLKTAVKTAHGVGWGYPFAWQSRTHYLPKHTPTIVTTSFVGQALIDCYQHSPSDEIRLLLTQIADYILHDVSQTRRQEGIAFGYAENDPQIVFNASLLGAAYLARTGALLGEVPYLDVARSAAQFVAQHQNENGSWYYGLEPSQKWMDSFHTGYVLLSLKEIVSSLVTDEFSEAIQNGYHFYRSVFFTDEGLPTYFPHEQYPVDTHSAAHAILTSIEFGDVARARKIAEWMCKHMQDNRGYFYYQKHRNYVNKVPYIRWSNAWMFLALATLMATEE